ncbi:MAG: glycosyltransferase family 2 protein [Candidatus Bathyarchaeota archaeon]|nr:glycosyltransferase family 2 protein [Candidatus Bathyarchaeota archaeon]
MGEIDVVMITKNSQRMLRQCIDSIYANVPVSRLIVVDGYSTDQTLQILDAFNKKYGNVKIISDSGNRATARQQGIAAVESEWFLFVDSDVVLCKDWYSKALRYVKPDVGAVWGIEVWSTLGNTSTLKLFLVVTRKIFTVRGGTHDTLVRTSVIKDIKIPTDLHVFEDAYIKDYIERKGFKVVACYVPFCIHYRPASVWTLKGSLGLIAESLRLGSFRLVAPLILAYGFYTVYSAYQLMPKKKPA